MNFVVIVCLIGVVPLLLYFLNMKVDKATRYLFPYILLLAIASLYEFFGTHLLKLNTSYWFRIYILLEFFTIWYFYFRLLKYKSFYLTYAIIYIIVYFFLLYNWSPNSKYIEDLPLNIAALILVLISSFFWFINVFKKLEEKPLYLRTEFYYISILLIYFSGTFLVFLMTDYIISNESMELLYYWNLIVIFNFIVRLTLIFTVWKARVKLEH